MLVLAACSTLKYSGEQTARTVSHDQAVDSAAYKRMIDQIVHEELQKWVDTKEWIQQTTVTERLSAPDSSGTQHVTDRTTTTLSRHSETSAGASQTKEDKIQERVDSTDIRTSDSIEIQEEKKASMAVKGRMPWYVYVVSLLGAALLGFVMGLFIKKKSILCR